jgi:hypothetical protein
MKPRVNINAATTRRLGRIFDCRFSPTAARGIIAVCADEVPLAVFAKR